MSNKLTEKEQLSMLNRITITKRELWESSGNESRLKLIHKKVNKLVNKHSISPEIAFDWVAKQCFVKG